MKTMKKISKTLLTILLTLSCLGLNPVQATTTSDSEAQYRSIISKIQNAQQLYAVGESSLTSSDVVTINGVDYYVLRIDGDYAELITKNVYDVVFDDGSVVQNCTCESGNHSDDNKECPKSYTWTDSSNNKTYTYNYANSSLKVWMDNFYNDKLKDSVIGDRISETEVNYATREWTGNYEFYNTETTNRPSTISSIKQHVFALDVYEANNYRSKLHFGSGIKLINYSTGNETSKQAEGFWIASGARNGEDVPFGYGIHYISSSVNSMNLVNNNTIGGSTGWINGARPVFWVDISNYLKFTANKDNSSVGLRYWSGSASYRVNGGDWQGYSYGQSITLANKGDYVEFKGSKIITGRYNKKNYCFFMSGDISASGDVTALTNNFGGDVSLSNQCYYRMFQDCTALTSIDGLKLPSSTLANQCYGAMFMGCSGLTSIPENLLPAKTLVDYCYAWMFSGTSVTTVPEKLFSSVETMGKYCYSCMFNSCKKLETIPENLLSLTTLTEGCYDSMFNTCIALKEIPEGLLPATTVANYAYQNMFYGCTTLTEVPSNLLKGTTVGQYCYKDMFANCSKITTLNNAQLKASKVEKGSYYEMFVGCSSLTSIPSNFLPATTVSEDSYRGMFNGCSSLTTVDTNLLPATTLGKNCYNNMFRSCTKLTNVPTLLATTLAESCYTQMFWGCSSIASLPAGLLPATTVAKSAYYEMFANCTSITELTTGLLPATTVSEDSYRGMFSGCKKLATVPASLLPATTLGKNCYNNMFRSCTSLSTLPNLPATTLVDSCYYEMFYGCSSIVLNNTGENAYRIPSGNTTGATANNALYHMFTSTSGEMNSTPEINKTYYLYKGKINASVDALITNYSGEYDGNTHSLTIDNSFDTSKYQIKYKDENGEYTLTTAPTVTNVNSDSPKTIEYVIEDKSETNKLESYYSSKTITIYKSTYDTPSVGEGYTLDYKDETLTAKDGYEISTSNSKSIALEDNKVEPGKTYYIRKVADSNHTASAWVEVNVASRPEITVVDSDINIVYGNSATISASSSQTIKYTSKDTDVVTVDTSGKLTTVNAGETKVTLKVEATSSSFANSKEVSVNVTKANAAVLEDPTAKTLTYTGSSQALINVGTASNGTLKYKLSTSSEWSDTLPTATDAGTYTVQYKVFGLNSNYNDTETKTLSVTINKENSTISTNPTAKSLIYSGESQVLVNSGSVTGGTLQYSLNENGPWSTTIPSKTDAGNYTVYYKVEGDDNHNGTEVKSLKVSIQSQDAALTTVPTANTLTYTGESQALITEGASSNGTLKYRLSGSNEWSTEIPTATNAGTYTVEYYVDGGSSNITSSSPASIEVTIEKANLSTTIDTTKITNKTYTGELIDLIDDNVITASTSSSYIEYSLDGAYYSTDIPTAMLADAYTIYYKAVGNENYNDSKVSTLTVNIVKAQATTTRTPTKKSNLVYTGENQELINVGLVEGGTLMYSLDGINYSEEVPQVKNAGDYTVYYYVKGDENYKDSEVSSVSCSISKATLTAGTNYEVPSCTAQQSFIYSGKGINVFDYTDNNAASSPEGTTVLYACVKLEDSNDIGMFLTPDDFVFYNEVPTINDVGYYVIAYKIDGGINYEDIDFHYETGVDTIGSYGLCYVAVNYSAIAIGDYGAEDETTLPEFKNEFNKINEFAEYNNSKVDSGTLDIELKNIVYDGTQTVKATTYTFEVTPKINGQEVHSLDEAITFRLPVITSAYKYADLYHEGEYIGQVDVESDTETENRYVSVTSSEFSEFQYVLTNTKAVTADDFDYDEENGVVNASGNKDLGSITTYYKVDDTWTTEKPTVPGTYEVGAVTSGSDDYKPTGSADEPFTHDWEYTVEKYTPTVDDFTYESSNGVVDAKEDTNLGTVTTYYNVNGTWTTTKPTSSGTYDVGAVTSGSNLYKAIGTSTNPFIYNWKYTIVANSQSTSTNTTGSNSSSSTEGTSAQLKRVYVAPNTSADEETYMNLYNILLISVVALGLCILVRKSRRHQQ